jgi:hypothetical protein
MGSSTKQNFFKEEIPMAKNTHENTHIFFGHKGNANQNHTKIPSHTC